MKALSLHEPWASLVAIEAKRIETRGWKLKERGEIAIHSAKTWPKYAQRMLSDPQVYTAWDQFGLDEKMPLPPGLKFKHGHIICIVEVLDCVPVEQLAHHPKWGERMTPREKALGDYTPDCGRYGFILGKVRVLNPAVPEVGRQRLWNWSEVKP